MHRMTKTHFESVLMPIFHAILALFLVSFTPRSTAADAAATATAAADPAPVIAWLGDNLVANGGIETEVANGQPAAWKTVLQGKGGTVSVVTDVRLTGDRSLRLVLSESAASASVSTDQIPVVAGKSYLFSLARRQAGFNSLTDYQNKYEGVNSYATVQWLNPERKPLAGGGNAGSFPYGATPWGIVDTFLLPPEGAAFAVFAVHIGNNSLKEIGKNVPSTLWLDAVQLREYRPPPTPDWALAPTPRVVDGGPETSPGRALFVAASPDFSNGRGGQWSKIVVDPAAERGSALQSPAGCGSGIMAHSTYFPAMPAGLYRLRVRIKVTDNTVPTKAGYLDVIGSSAGPRLLLEIRPQAFAAANEYQVLERDFVLRDNGWWDIRVFTEGNQAWSIDSAKVVPLQELQDLELMAIYPGIGGEINPALKPRGQDKTCRVLFVAGPEYDVFKPRALRLLAQTVEIKTAWLKCGMFQTITDFPETPEQLFDFSAIVLANIPAKILSLSQKNYLLEYVRRGGALVLLGGDQAFERGGMHGSLLESALPVKSAATVLAGLSFAPEGLRLSPVASPLPHWLQECEFEPAPYAYFLHQVQAQPEATVFVTAGDRPFLVGGKCGKGRVMCVLGWPFGDPPAGQTAFWAWPDWVYLFRNATWWAMQRQGID